jgi:ABC-type multidrug transport system ATPase subunit
MSNTPERPEAAVFSENLTKRFGARVAVAGVALRVEAGSIYGFLGPNGAGKTTIIRLILGLLRPTQGSVQVFGRDVARERIKAARQIGSLLEARATYDHLTGRENLDGTRRLLGLEKSEIDRVLDLVEITAAADRKVGHYSLGMRQRLGLARALLGHPRLLVLDEPTNGLDPDGMRELRGVIRGLPERTGATVFLSSHLLQEVEQLVSHVGVIRDGRLVLQGAIREMLALIPSDLLIRTSDNAGAATGLRQAGLQPRLEDDRIRLRLTRGDDEAAQITRRLVEHGFDVFEATLRRGSLEELYLQSSQAKAA